MDSNKLNFDYNQRNIVLQNEHTTNDQPERVKCAKTQKDYIAWGYSSKLGSSIDYITCEIRVDHKRKGETKI